MTTHEINDNLIKLISPNGIKDLRDNTIYSEVICNKKDVNNFKEVE